VRRLLPLLVLVAALSGCFGGGDDGDGGAAPRDGADAATLDFPATATRNTTRVDAADSAQAAAAIALGAATALVARELPVHEVVALALVVATGTGIAGWRRLGPVGSWVPVSALVILILGERDPSS
jgi:hypothetical protein